MNRNIIKSIQVALTVAAAITLVACGGGGGTTPVVSTPTTPAGTVPIVTAATSSGYVGEELVVFNNLNAARSACGFGYLQQNAQLDLAAYNHVNWEVRNNTFDHNETPSTAGFTGVTSGARLNTVGYSNWQTTGEDLFYRPIINKPGSGDLGVRSLLGAPYHLASLMQGHREVGISLKTGGSVGSGADIEYTGSRPVTHLNIEMASSTTTLKQAQLTTDVLTYPCAGTTGTATTMSGEYPSPIPARNFATQPAGQSVFIQLAEGRTLAITTASIVTTIGTSPILLAATLTSSNDPNSMLTQNQAVLLPNAPLAPNTQYTVIIQGTNNGAMFLKTFTFTTGS